VTGTEAIERFDAYVDQLPWYPGKLDESSYCAFLRAGSLGVDRQMALDAVSYRLSAVEERIRPRKLESQQTCFNYVQQARRVGAFSQT
jgi:hypothetical protein